MPAWREPWTRPQPMKLSHTMTVYQPTFVLSNHTCGLTTVRTRPLSQRARRASSDSLSLPSNAFLSISERTVKADALCVGDRKAAQRSC